MNETNREYLFKNVLTLPFFWFPLGGLLFGMPLFIIYGEFGFAHFGVWGLIFTALVFFAGLSWLIKYLSKTIIIRFSPNEMQIKIDGKKINYNKKDIAGIYTHDYQNSRVSLISVQIRFINEKNIEITDSKFTEKYDVALNRELKKFISAIENELGFVNVEKSRLRSFQKMGAFWYARN